MWQKKLLLFTTCVLFIASACQTEDFTTEGKRLDSITSRTISFEEMSRETGAKEAVLPFIRPKSGNSLARNLVYNSQYGFYVDTDEILMKQKGDDITFTLAVYRDNTDGKSENLVLTKQRDGSYAVYLIKYDLTQEDKEKLLNGFTIADIDSKTEFFMLNTAAKGTADSGYFHAGDVITLEDGRCMRINHVTRYLDGAFAVTGAIVPCPPEEPADPNLGEDGQGSGGYPAATGTWFYVPIHSYPGEHIGNPSNPDGVGTGTGGNPPSGNHGDDDPNVIPPLLTQPLIFTEDEENPCNKLKKLMQPGQGNGNLKPDIDWLKSKIEGTSNNREYGVEVKVNLNPDTGNYDVYEPNHVESEDYLSVELFAGSSYIGGAHTHPNNGHPMFSFGDVLLLRDMYESASPMRKSQVFFSLVCHNELTGLTHVYSITVQNFEQLNAGVEAVLNDPKFGNLNLEQKKDKIHKKQKKIYDNCNGAFSKSFLQQFQTFGISLYEATDDSLNNWNKLELESNADEINVKSLPCN